MERRSRKQEVRSRKQEAGSLYVGRAHDKKVEAPVLGV